MGKLVVEYNGKLRSVKIEILRQLLHRGYVTLDTRLLEDGKEKRVGDVIEQLPSPHTSHNSDRITRMDSSMNQIGDVLQSHKDSDSAPSIPVPEEGSMFSIEDLINAQPGQDLPIANDLAGSATAWPINSDERLTNYENFANGRINEGNQELNPNPKNTVIKYCLFAIIGVVVCYVIFYSLIENVNKKYQIEPFDTEITTIPKGYNGVDFEALYEKLEKVQPFTKPTVEKMEEETEEEFEKRQREQQNTFANSPILGTITRTSQIAIKLDPKQIELDVSSSGIVSLCLEYIEGISRPCIKIDNKYSDGNVMIESFDHGIALRDIVKKEPIIPLAFEVQHDKSLKVKDIGVLIVFKIDPSVDPKDYENVPTSLNDENAIFIETSNGEILDDSRIKEVINGPIVGTEAVYFSKGNGKDKSTYTGFNYIYGRDIEIWIYNEKTGEILHKEPLHFEKNLEVPEFSEAMVGQENSLSSDGSASEKSEASDVESSHTTKSNDLERDRNKEKTKSETQSKYSKDKSLEPFDSTINQIDPLYEGVDIDNLSRKLMMFWSKLDKEEYEKSSDYQTRRREFLADAMNASLDSSGATPGSKYAAVWSSNISGLVQKYDADEEVLTIQIIGQGHKKSGNKGYCKIGNDKFGGFIVAEEVEIQKTNDYELTKYDGLRFFYSCSSEEAKELRGHVNALVVFNLDVPLYSAFEPGRQYNSTDSSFESSFSRNKDYSCDTYQSYYTNILGISSYGVKMVYAKELEVWFFDNRTGEILKKSVLSGEQTSKDNKDSTTKTSKSDDMSQNVVADELPEEETPPKTWPELLAESIDEQANWEKKKPSIMVPGDAATLAEAIEKAQSGDVIQLGKSYNAYSLGVKLGSDRQGIVIDKPLAIVGETGDASDVVVKVGVRESIFIESKSAMFKGITFQCGPLGLEKTCEPIISVSGDGSATFKYCSFLGDKVERSVGVQIEGVKAKANFWKCNFQQFGDAGLVVKEKGAATLRYCEFLSQNHYGFSVRTDSTVSLERCHFADNEIAFQAETGGGCEIVESRFEQNERRADISAASRNKVKETDNVYDRK